MDRAVVAELMAQGENISIEFKSNNVRPEALAREMAAFSNTFGGTVLIGVEDDGAITGVHPPHDEEWISNIARNNIFDIAPVERTNMASLDPSKLHQYFETYYQLDYINIPEEEQHQILTNTDILVEKDNEYRVSVGGLLLFGKQPQRYLPQSSVMFAVFRGNDLTDELADKKEITGALPEQIENTTALVQLFLPKPSVINGLKREEQLLIPVKVIRETLVNAVCHRDYSMSTQKISVYLFSDRIEVTSPGRIPNTATVTKMLAGYSAPRNIFLVKYLDNMRYIDGLGRGIPMIKRAMQERVCFEEIGAMFRVTLHYPRELNIKK